ncbi:uncharacterized protein Tco025E_04264 [Trypanosoma conorhini]|uniref:C3H1-type domain-containing protein n=1 Tax=Trypanosoma conorhini TaxID=83891 RepID=A0A3R7PEY3_9TRYP|nr:uncharacterized protein Tco025E_04264 [Trypanosoma conorhini]RNF18935.1 hypothetical protein Tco025E_04264 [Trypanosoma conorhini]
MLQVPGLWTAEQQRRQVAELYRNKGLICPDYFRANKCPRGSTCSYIHIRDGETRKVPLSVCHFYMKRACLRDNCMFFHGTQTQLDQLHAMGAETYRPQDYMAFAVPPPELMGMDGGIAPQVVPMPIPVPASNLVNPMPVSKPGAPSPLMLLLVDVAATTQYGMYWSPSPAQTEALVPPVPLTGMTDPRNPALTQPYTVLPFFQ